MKKFLLMSSLFVMIIITISCDDKKELIFIEQSADSVSVFKVDTIVGNDTVSYGLKYRYYTPQQIGAFYKWSVSGASFKQVEDTTNGLTNAINVTFDGTPIGGNVSISVYSKNKDSIVGNVKTVKIVTQNHKPTATLSWQSGAVKKVDQVDTLIIVFDQDMATDPLMVIKGGGVLGGFIKSPNNKKILKCSYTASIRENDTIIVYGAKELDKTGGLIMTPAVINANVDNTSPVAKIIFSQNILVDSVTCQITAMFNEDMSSKDSIFINVNGPGDDLVKKMMTINPENPTIWKYDYTHYGGGDGIVTVSLSGGEDLVGNKLKSIYNNTIILDNSPPSLYSVIVFNRKYDFDLKVSSTESGTIYYSIVKEGTVITDYKEVVNNGFSFSIGNKQCVAHETTLWKIDNIPSGNYTIFLVANDQFGHFSAITSEQLVTD